MGYSLQWTRISSRSYVRDSVGTAATIIPGDPATTDAVDGVFAPVENTSIHSAMDERPSSSIANSVLCSSASSQARLNRRSMKVDSKRPNMPNSYCSIEMPRSHLKCATRKPSIAPSTSQSALIVSSPCSCAMPKKSASATCSRRSPSPEVTNTCEHRGMDPPQTSFAAALQLGEGVSWIRIPKASDVVDVTSVLICRAVGIRFTWGRRVHSQCQESFGRGQGVRPMCPLQNTRGTEHC